MPIESYRLGPGSLVLDDGSPFDLSLQVTACRINPSETVQTSDAVKVLGGGELPAEDTVSYRYTISGSVLQDIAAAGVVAWTWDREGEFVDFVFVPSDSEARQASGRCRIVPLTFGGDEIEGRPQSEFEWVCEAKPVLGVAV